MDRFLPFEYRASFKQLLLKFSLEVIVVVLMGIFAILVLKTIFPRFINLLTGTILLLFVFFAATFIFARNNLRYLKINKDHFIFANILGKTIQIPTTQITSVSGRGNNKVCIKYSDKKINLPLDCLPQKNQVIFEYILSRILPHHVFPAPVQTKLNIIESYEEKVKAGQVPLEQIEIKTNNRKLSVKRILLALFTAVTVLSLIFAAYSAGWDVYFWFVIGITFSLIIFVSLWWYWTKKAITLDPKTLIFDRGNKRVVFNWQNIELVSISTQPYIHIWTKESSKKISYRHFEIEDVENMLDALQKRAIFHDVPIG